MMETEITQEVIPEFTVKYCMYCGEKNKIRCVGCCRGIFRCCQEGAPIIVGVISLIFIMVPFFIEFKMLLNYYAKNNDNQYAKTVLIVNSCLLIIGAVFAAIKFAFDLRVGEIKDDKYESNFCNCKNAFIVIPCICMNDSWTKKLIPKSGYLILLLTPWYICNFVATLNLHNNFGTDSQMVLWLGIVPIFIYPFFLFSGCITMNHVEKCNRKQFEKSKYNYNSI